MIWLSHNDFLTCEECKKLYGKIFPTNLVGSMIQWPLHPHCRCRLEGVGVLPAGYATQDGLSGADYWLANKGRLPENYLSKEEAALLGWKSKKGNLEDVAKGKIIGGNVYYNDNGHLPQKEGRIWYEADINYTSGYRGMERILYSNDGLIFVTYDHYQTFYEISK